MTTVFDWRSSLGARAPKEIADYLQSIDDFDGAAALVSGGVTAQSASLFHRAYKPTGMAIGFIAPRNPTSKAQIVGGSSFTADAGLIRRRIKILLDKFYVHEYPGMGKHTILCEFAGKNQVEAEEALRYAVRFDVNDQAAAGISGVPIFLGLTVGPDGISFEGRTVNVKSSADDFILDTLGSAAFKGGLSLVLTAQPALKPFTGLATAAVKAIAERKRNAQIHTFNLGLDFGGSATSARLRLGTYVVVQTDAEDWKWSDYYWDLEGQHLRSVVADEIPEVNYMAFSVSEYSRT